ncbi:cysteine desulfurase family protein [Lutimonas halocynthiae]|uniref:cysteine desulfurase family protein n=1 Tax=Lutimonas halocynthiae TaxID=1446477 RepID=UPI0025B58C20|nr:cysteine desulfurase family protein [Lutimonas halocynthiae]MDN3644111.1 cysteine desulfurase family protein [Lutimonas halocynthiae]
MQKKLYLDYNATTPCDPAVVDAMLPFLSENFGNTSSIHHSFGWLAEEAVEASTDQIANILGISPDNIIYTSGSTEGINMVLKSFSNKYKPSGSHIITCKTEHKAVLDTCAYMEKYEGVSVTYLNVDTSGLINLNDLKAALRPETVLLAIMYANNETGVIQPIQDIAKIIADQNIFLFIDATQALGKVELYDALEVADFACFSAHKAYGPKGIGLVYYKDNKAKKALHSFIQGGGQQKTLRGGTINTPGIVGFAKSIELSCENLSDDMIRITQLRDQLEEGLLRIELSSSNGHSAPRLPNTCNISFPFVNGADLLRALSKDIAVSNGSACNAASENPSHVLTAMRIDPDLAFSSLRFSIGKYTSEEDIIKTINIVDKEVNSLREKNILWERRKN